MWIGRARNGSCLRKDGCLRTGVRVCRMQGISVLWCGAISGGFFNSVGIRA